MHRGNAQLRGEGEKVSMSPQRMNEYIKCSQDIIYFAEKYFKIVDLDKGEVIIQLREYQKRILKAMVGGDGDPRRHIALLSARQIGKCFCDTMYINIRDKKTNETVKISIGDLYRKMNTTNK